MKVVLAVLFAAGCTSGPASIPVDRDCRAMARGVTEGAPGLFDEDDAYQTCAEAARRRSMVEP